MKYLAAKEEEAAERISILQGALMRKEDLLEETGKKLALLEEQVLNSTNSKANTDHETAIELSQQSVIEAETQSQLASLKEQLALMDSNYKCCKLELGNTKNARAALETEISKIKTDYSILEDEFEELATSQV